MAYTRGCQPDEIVGTLHKLAEMYRELEKKTFLFVSADRKTGEYYSCEITFLPKNFMHLNGFSSKTKNATDFYRDCLKTPPHIIYKTDCSRAYNHDIKTVQAKMDALKELLDLKKAKYFFSKFRKT